MGPPVISHQRLHRKRGGWRRFGALMVTLAALGVATWLSPYVYPPLGPPAHAPVQQAAAPSPKLPSVIKVVERVEVRPLEHARAARRLRPSTAPAGRTEAVDEVEVLSADELDAISQARE